MPFKKKAVVKVGTKDWEVLVPRPQITPHTHGWCFTMNVMKRVGRRWQRSPYRILGALKGYLETFITYEWITSVRLLKNGVKTLGTGMGMKSMV